MHFKYFADTDPENRRGRNGNDLLEVGVTILVMRLGRGGEEERRFLMRDVEARWIRRMSAERRLRAGANSIVRHMYSHRRDLGKGIPVLTSAFVTN